MGLFLKEIFQLIGSESENCQVSGNEVRNCDFPSKAANINQPSAHQLLAMFWLNRSTNSLAAFLSHC